MPRFLLFAGVDRRTAWLRGCLLSACLLSLIASAPLWLNARVFPLLPLTPGFPILTSPWDKLFFSAMLVLLVLAGRFYRPAVTIFLICGLFAFCEDQNRGQPWFYMYFVMLGLTLLPTSVSLAACRAAISIAYIWSGIQKFNPKFFQIVPAWFVAPAAHWPLPAVAADLLRAAVAAAPFVELTIGLALWMPRFRLAAIGMAVIVHLTALLFLGPLGYNFDVVIWPWNLAMLALLVILFPTRAGGNHQGPELRQTFTELCRSKRAVAIVALYAFLPTLSFCGWWDSYFSFTLFAENQAKADIFVSQAFRDRLPPKLKAHVVALGQGYDPRIQLPYAFDFQGWALEQLHAPSIFEPRGYRSIFAFLRKWSSAPDDLHMIIVPRTGPPVFYQDDKNWSLLPIKR
jgi:hypothetical protein